jgi:hypothetical protein
MRKPNARRLRVLTDENAKAEESAGRGDARQRHVEGSQLKECMAPRDFEIFVTTLRLA